MPKTKAPELLLLDTHVWIWIQNADTTLKGSRALRHILSEGSAMRLSIMSVWEVGMLETKGRINLEPDCESWVNKGLRMPGLKLAPLTPEVALVSSRLPGDFEGDPVDRILAATAQLGNMTLVTRDRDLLQYAARGHFSALQA